MRIFIGGIAMETNSFTPVLADCGNFHKGYWVEGGALVHLCQTVSMDVSGFYSYLKEQPDVEPFYGFTAYAVTSGKVADRAFDEMTDRLLSSLKSALPVDGVLLGLHGAMQSESIDDCEGYLIKRVRAVVGQQARIAAAYDLHACLTPEMMEFSDSLSGYRTYPHTDHAAAGFRAAEGLVRLIREDIRPQKLYRRIPMIMPVENCNTVSGPIVPVFARVEKLLANPDVVSGGLFLTQPWLDVPDLGCMMGLFLRPEADRAGIEREMDAILETLWTDREKFLVEVPSIDEALEISKDSEKLCCIVELGDIVSAGGTGDSTVALDALLRHPESRPAAMTLTDPESVRRACAIGAGGQGRFELGGSDTGYNMRIPVDARVEFLSDKKAITSGETQKGVAVDAGMRALLRSGDLWIIAGTYPSMSHDKEIYRSMGVDPEKMDIIIQKTHQMFKAGFAGIMKSHVYADTPGETDRNLRRLPYRRVRRPIWPLDGEEESSWKTD